MYWGNSVCRWIFSINNISKPTEDSRLLGADQDVKNEKELDLQKIKEKQEEIDNKTGRVIGLFERIIIGIGILLQSWPIVAGVVALKSISRYKELDHQMNAEYFLVGSMVSILWAFVVTFLFIYLNFVLKEKGFNTIIEFIIQYAKPLAS